MKNFFKHLGECYKVSCDNFPDSVFYISNKQYDRLKKLNNILGDNKSIDLNLHSGDIYCEEINDQIWINGWLIDLIEFDNNFQNFEVEAFEHFMFRMVSVKFMRYLEINPKFYNFKLIN